MQSTRPTEITVMPLTELPADVQELISQHQRDRVQEKPPKAQGLGIVAALCIAGALGLAVLGNGRSDRPSYQQLEREVRLLEIKLYAEQQRSHELRIRLTEAYAGRGYP